jgi:hypothetical protein
MPVVTLRSHDGPWRKPAHLTKAYSPNLVGGEFSEVELRLYGVLRSCARPCNPSYLYSSYNTSGQTVPPFGERSKVVSEDARDRSLDELAKGLASGTLSRRKALHLMGAALLGGALASVPGVALAAPKPGSGRGGGGKSACAKYCQSLFGANTPAEQQCVSEGTAGTGPCFSCSPTTGCGPNFQKPTCTVTGQSYNCSTCQCECPSPQTVVDGACVDCPTSTTCAGSGGTLDPNTCECSCPSGAVCSGGHVCDPFDERDCVCPGGTRECGGRCVSTSCPEGQFLKFETCQCAPTGVCTAFYETCNSSCVCRPNESGQLLCAQASISSFAPRCTTSAECPGGAFCEAGLGVCVNEC